MSVIVECAGGALARIALGVRRNGRKYADSDGKVLVQTAPAVGQAIGEDGGLYHLQARAAPA